MSLRSFEKFRQSTQTIPKNLNTFLKNLTINKQKDDNSTTVKKPEILPKGSSQPGTDTNGSSSDNSTEKARKRIEQITGHFDKPIFKEVILGAGATSHYHTYIAVRGGRAIDPSKSIIIGMTQPWSKDRGRVVISQSKRMITVNSGETPESQDNTWALSEDFSLHLEDNFEKSGINRINAEVIKVARNDKGLYEITYVDNGGNKQTIYAHRVFDAMGPGKHDPLFIDKNLIAKTDAEARTKRIMDMDMFARTADTLESPEKRAKTEIIVLGSNAGVGAVFEALRNDYKVKWITGPEGAKFPQSTYSYAAVLPYLKARLLKESDPSRQEELQAKISEIENGTVLEKLYHPDQHAMFKGVAEKFKQVEINELHLQFAADVKMTEDGKVEVMLQNKKKVTGDYLVYAMGPDLKPYYQVLDEAIRKDLVPRLHTNYRFSDKKTVTGLQSRDGSLIIIGSGADRLHVHPDMINVKDTMPANVPSDDSLPALLAKVMADAEYVPDDISERAEFDWYDRTLLAIHMSLKYPRIADYKLSEEEKQREPALRGFTFLGDAIVERIYNSRNPKGEIPGSKPDDLLLAGPKDEAVIPYRKSFNAYWKKELDALNDRLKFKSPYLRAKPELIKDYRDLLSEGKIDMTNEIVECMGLMSKRIASIDKLLKQTASQLQDYYNDTGDRASAVKKCNNEFKKLHSDIHAGLVHQTSLYVHIRNKLASELRNYDSKLDTIAQQEAAKRLMPLPQIVQCQKAFEDLIKALDRGFPYKYAETIVQAVEGEEWTFDKYVEKLMQDYQEGKLEPDQRKYAEKLIQDYYNEHKQTMISNRHRDSTASTSSEETPVIYNAVPTDGWRRENQKTKTVEEAWKAVNKSWQKLSEALEERVPTTLREKLPELVEQHKEVQEKRMKELREQQLKTLNSKF